MVKHRRIGQFVIGIMILVSIVGMYMVHRLVPFMLDDLWYSTKLFNEEPIRNFKDIIEAQIWHYHNWGGRSVAHMILQVTLLMGESWADIWNVAVTCVLAFLMTVVSGIHKEHRMAGIWIALSMLIALNANWGESMFWQAGAANYLYMTVFLLLFLQCYLRELEVGSRPLRGIVFWIIPLGIAAGWSNENMGPTVFIISVFVMALKKKEKSRIPLWMLLGSLACLIGSILMIVAPGNFVRVSEIPQNQYGFLWRAFLRGYAESKGLLEYLFPGLLVLAEILLAARLLPEKILEMREKLLLLGALLSWGAMILSPHYPDRSSFGTMVLIACVVIGCGSKIAKIRDNMRLPLLMAGSFLWLKEMYALGRFCAECWGWIV